MAQQLAVGENLSSHEITRRLRIGIVALGVALGLAGTLHALEAPAWTRLFLFLPFFVAENIFFQAVHKTCGFSALKGLRHDGNSETMADPTAREQCQCVGKKQIFHTLLAASCATALFYFIG